MIATLGILSLLQLTIVPGLIFVKIFKINGFWENLLAAIGLSQLFNYLFVVLATLCNVYTQVTILILFGIEVLLLCILYFHNLNYKFGKIINFEAIRNFFNEYTSKIVTNVEWKKKIFTYFYWFIFFIAVIILIKNFVLYIMHPTQVFSAWDAVGSWNKWATQWFQGLFPLQTWHYPQLWTANLSIPYQFIGTAQVNYFSKYFANLVDFFIIAIVFVLGIKKRDVGYFIGIIFVSWLMGVFGSRGNGYADSPVAFWGLMTLAFLLFSEDREDEIRLILLGSLFASAAALTKQAGIWMVVMYPILIALRKSSKPKKSTKIILQSILIMVLMVAPWYLYKQIQIHFGIDSSEVSTNIGIVINNHTWIEIISSAQKLFLTTIMNPFFSKHVTFYLLISLSVLSFKDKFWRNICCLIIIPFWIGWMLLISYDTRNLNMIIPLLGISAGVGLRNILQLDLTKLTNFYKLKKVQSVLHFTKQILISIFKFFSTWKIWYFLLFVPILFILPYWISDSRLIKHSLEKQRYIGDPYVNQQIYYFKDNYGLNGKILTPYVFLAFLPELDKYTVYLNFNIPEFYDKFNDPEIGYILFDPEWISEDVHDFIFNLIDENKIKIILEFEPTSQNGYYYFVTTCHGVCK